MRSTPSAYDRAHVREILSGEGDWFGAMLLRLIHKADDDNRAAIREAFPEHVEAYETWLNGYQ